MGRLFKEYNKTYLFVKLQGWPSFFVGPFDDDDAYDSFYEQYSKQFSNIVFNELRSMESVHADYLIQTMIINNIDKSRIFHPADSRLLSK